MAIDQWFYLDSTSGGFVLGAIVITFVLLEIRARRLNPSRLPVFNDRKWWEIGYGKATKRYISDPEGMIKSGLEKVCEALFMQSQLIYMCIADLGGNNWTIGRRCILSVHRGTFSLDPKPEICRCDWRR